MSRMQSNCATLAAVALAILVVVAAVTGCGTDHTSETAGSAGQGATPSQRSMTVDEYLQSGDEEWFLTGKRSRTVQAMMVSQETSFRNDLEMTDYTVDDDETTVVLKGSVGEMWASDFSKVAATYTKPDGSELSTDDFAEKDLFIDIVTIPTTDSNFAMFVPEDIAVTIETSWGDILHTNLEGAPHGDGDYLVCRVGEDGAPDLSDIWVVNGVLFPEYYEMGR